MPIAANSCKTADERQGFSPQIYAGDSSKGAIVRDQAKEVIKCDDRRFDEMFCMFDRDLENLFQRCLEQVEADRAWYNFGEKKAGKLEIEKPAEADDNEGASGDDTKD